jgi:hypothetical protein
MLKMDSGKCLDTIGKNSGLDVPKICPPGNKTLMHSLPHVLILLDFEDLLLKAQ